MMHDVIQHEGAERGGSRRAEPFLIAAQRRPSNSNTSRVVTRVRLACALALLAGVLAGGACRRAVEPPPPPRPAQTTGTLTLDGLRAPVTVVRDQWGIPHITAQNQDDLFFAQGFVQAQDRLFQMDLWKRASQGRLAEVLGSNFIERDVMTRRIRVRGRFDEEWASYGPDTRQIATAFTNGINAWVRLARADVPEEFVLAGWLPEFWKPEDLLSRTDAFLASGNALDELFRARLVAAIGVSRADALLPLPGGARTVVDQGLDVGAITYVVPDAVRRIGTPPFVPALSARVTDLPRPGASRLQALAPADAAASGATPGGASVADLAAHLPRVMRAGATAAVARVSREGQTRPLVMVSEVGTADAPSRRYLVHLQAPGWHVAGATSPWLPGVAIGHNERLAWAMAPARADTQDIFVERYNPENPRQVRRGERWVDMDVDIERVALKGRDEPYEYERQYTSNGVVIAMDKERHLLYTLRWSGTEPGGAADLAALQLNRAATAADVERALEHWQMPVSEFVYALADGTVGQATAGRVPVRAAGGGSMPREAWSGRSGWTGFARATSSSASAVTSALVATSDGPERRAEVRSYLDRRADLGDSALLAALHRPALAPAVATSLRILRESRAVPADLEPARRALLDAWSHQDKGDPSGMLALWQSVLFGSMTNFSMPQEFTAGLQEHEDWSNIWSYDKLLRRHRPDSAAPYLLKALKEWAGLSVGVGPVTFVHALAAFPETRKRFNVSPAGVPGSEAVRRLSGGRFQPVFGLIMDTAAWNRSTVRTGPGQSGSPSSPHYDDLAAEWSSGRVVNLLFDQISGDRRQFDTLQLDPRSTRTVR